MSSAFRDPRRWLEIVPATLIASPLYSALWEGMKDDAELLALLDLIPKDQPLPITFFTAVNFLVLGALDDPFARFYPSLHPEETQPVSEAYPLFRACVLAHRETLTALLPVARLQTNEVTRCANLLPAFVLAYRRGGYQPLHMLEIGSSAGLNLLWDRYGYHYSIGPTDTDLVLGNPLAPVQVRCELATTRAFPFGPDTVLPRVASCQGIEIYPRDIHDEDDMRWVRAAIWPEEVERHHTLDAALAFARQTPVLVHQGDACKLLPDLLAAIPTTQTALIWHSFAVNQGPPEVKARLHQQMADASWSMPMYRIGLEVVPEARLPQLEFTEYRGGQVVTQEVLAHCALHGEHMTWIPSF